MMVAPLPGTWVADRYGDSCYQWNYEYLPYSEDCLCLNVWRPHPHKENRAVMVGGHSTSQYFNTKRKWQE